MKSSAARQSEIPISVSRGDPQSPCSEAAGVKLSRVLAVKVEIDWRDAKSRELFNRLRDLGWQAAHYRNNCIRSMWAEATGLRVDPEQKDKHDVSKRARQMEKGELSGAAYSAAEREVSAAWTRDRKKILAGQPLPEWKPSAALSIRGHKEKKSSGVRIEMEDGQYVAYLQAQSDKSPGGSWSRVPIAKNTKRDEYQGEILNAMVSWAIPIAKATVQMKRSSIILRLTYEKERPPLPSIGKRVATLGPLEQSGRLLLRTELQTKDYTAEFANLMERKDSWDKIRRRALAQVGWRRGQARMKRKRLANLTWEDWLLTHLHTWTRRVIDWAVTQGVGTIQVVSIDTKDWPAYKFMQLLRYKADEAGIEVKEDGTEQDAGADRAVKSVIRKSGKAVKRRHEALRELQHQMEEK